MAKLIIDNQGIKHLKGSGLNGFETMCGNVDIVEERYTYEDGTPDCESCIIGAKDLLRVATAKEIKSWKI